MGWTPLRASYIMEYVREEDLDIICLQEMNTENKEVEESGYKYFGYKKIRSVGFLFRDALVPNVEFIEEPNEDRIGWLRIKLNNNTILFLAHIYKLN